MLMGFLRAARPADIMDANATPAKTTMTTPTPDPAAAHRLTPPAGMKPDATARLSALGRCLAWMRVVILSTYPIVGTAIAFYVVAFSDQGVCCSTR